MSKNKTNTSSDRFYEILMLIAFGGFIIFVTTFKIWGDDDLFWHLATGKYIVENKVVPSADVFGFVTSGKPWMPFEWGWDVLNYLIYTFSGYTGISIFRTVVFLLMFALYFRLFYKFKANIPIAVLISILLIFGIFERLSAKPQIMTYLFFSAVIYILADYRYFSRKISFVFYMLPFIFILWANMHMGVLAGLGIFFIFILSEIFTYAYPKNFSNASNKPPNKNNLIKSCIIFLASLLAILVNPHGINTFLYVQSHMNMKLLENVNEWLSPFHQIYIGKFFNVIYALFLICSVPVAFYLYRVKDLFGASLTIIFALFSLRAARYSIDFEVITFIYFVLAASYLIRKIKSKKFRAFFDKPAFNLAVTLILILFILTFPNNSFYRTVKYFRTSGIGVDPYYYPVKIFDFIKQNNIAEIGSRPFNSFSIGGYFIWELPGKKNFIDSRNLYDEIFEDYMVFETLPPGFEKKLKDFNFDYIIWNFPDLWLQPWAMEQSIVIYLMDHPDEWKLIYWDDQTLLFVKNEPKFKDLIAKYETKYINPFNFTYRQYKIIDGIKNEPEIVNTEFNRYYTDNPKGYFINGMKNVYMK